MQRAAEIRAAGALAAEAMSAGVAVVGDRVYVAGPATFGTAGKGPSVVTVLNRASGDLITEIPIAGEQLAFEHALSGIAVADHGDALGVAAVAAGLTGAIAGSGGDRRQHGAVAEGGRGGGGA